MSCWICLADAAIFDFEAFFAIRPSVFCWRVAGSPHQIEVGERAYIWRYDFHNNKSSGVVAEAVVCESPTMPAIGSDFYFAEAKASNQKTVLLKLIGLASTKEQLRHGWLKGDPLLGKNEKIVRAGIDQNFKLSDAETDRLDQMWLCVGQNWSRSESIAGMWAYSQTVILGIVSKLPGSVVANVSLLTGRAVGGVYNKVMNYRSIDPREERAGMDGAGQVDRLVWKEFYDSETRTIRHDALNAEFNRLWRPNEGRIDPKPDANFLGLMIAREVAVLTDRSYDDLLLQYINAIMVIGAVLPTTRAVRQVVFDRAPLIIALAKVRAAFQCEVVGCEHLPFIGRDGKPYCEVHHIRSLSDGGPDSIDNVVCLCPSHHREAHYGENSESLKTLFLNRRMCG